MTKIQKISPVQWESTIIPIASWCVTYIKRLHVCEQKTNCIEPPDISLYIFLCAAWPHCRAERLHGVYGDNSILNLLKFLLSD